MAANHPLKTILVIGPGPRRASGRDQFAHGVVDACIAMRSAGHPVILLDNAPYLAWLPEDDGLQRMIEPLTPDVLRHILAHHDVDQVYADAGGESAQRLAVTAGVPMGMGAGPQIIAAALDRSCLFKQITATGLSTPPHAIVDSVAAALDAACDMDFPIRVAVTEHDAHVREENREDTARATIATAGSLPRLIGSPALIYNLSDLGEWAEKQLEIDTAAKLLLEKALLGWQPYEVIVLRDGKGQQAICGIQAYLEPTGVPASETGWVQPPVDLAPQLYATLSQTSFDFLERSDLKGVASLTLAVDSAAAKVVLTDLAVGNSRNIAFAAVSGGRPLFELATRLALGASLSEAYPEVAVSDDVVTVRLPIASGASRPDIRRSEGLNRLTQGDAMGIGPSFGDAFLRTLAATELPGEDVAPGSPMGSVRDGLHRYQEMRSTMQGDVSQSAESNAAAIAPWVMAALSEDAAQAPSPSGVGDPFVRLSASGPQTVPEYRWGRLSTTAKALGPKSKQRILVIAGRPNAIGQSREMDQAAAQSITALRDSGCEVMVLACDPLSAMLHAGGDTPICLGAATAATVLAIHQQWPLDGLMAHCAPGAFYGLASELATTGIAILGTSSRAIALLTSPMALHERLTKLGIPHPRCAMVSDVDAALEQADTIGYPLLIRPLTPSGGEPNLGGDSTSLIMNAEMLTATLQSKAFTDTSCLMEEFIEFAIEVTADALCDGNDTTMPQAVEHIELAGVHPGDSAWVIPPYSTPLRHVDTIAEYLHRIALEFDLKGFLSGRFALYNDTVYLLSADVAFSRTAAMVSDACAVPIFATATRLMLGESLSAKRLPVTRRGFYVREAVFPVSTDAKLASRLGPVMQSTGEVIGRADSFGLAYYNAQKAAGDRLPTEGCVLITVTDADKPSIIEPARLYREMGFRLLATRGTAGFLDSNGIATETVRKLGMGRPDLVDAIKTRQVDLIINTPSGHQGQMDDSYIRKAAIDYKIPYVSTPAGALAAAKGIAARRRQQERG